MTIINLDSSSTNEDIEAFEDTIVIENVNCECYNYPEDDMEKRVVWSN